MKEVKEPSVPCGVSFPLFFPLLERKEAVGDRTSLRHSREYVSVSGVQMLFLSLSQNLQFCQFPHQREPLWGGERQKQVVLHPEREEVPLGYVSRVADFFAQIAAAPLSLDNVHILAKHRETNLDNFLTLCDTRMVEQ
jgi:hypothetical protein